MNSTRFRHLLPRGFWPRLVLTALLIIVGFLAPLNPGRVLAANPAPVQIFYITLPETVTDDHVNTVFEALDSADTVQPYYTYFSIAIGANGTLVYYDQWENGYDASTSPTPVDLYDSTLNPVACRSGATATTRQKRRAPWLSASDVLNAGDVIIPNNAVPYPRSTAILFDGKDKIGASSSIAMARATWATGSGTLNAFAHEMYATAEWGTAYESPVGTNTRLAARAQTCSSTAALSIMAVAEQHDRADRRRRERHLRDHGHPERRRQLPGHGHPARAHAWRAPTRPSRSRSCW